NRVDHESIRGFEGLRHAVERAEDQARSVEKQPLRVPRQGRNMLRPTGRMVRMLKVLAACAAGVVCLAGCASTIALPTPSASSVPSANSPAADVRARMALLMGAQNLSAPLNISTSSANRMLTDQVTTIKQFIDDAATGTPSAFYPDVRAAYAKSTAMGGSIAEAAVWKFPDKYPGDVTTEGSKAR